MIFSERLAFQKAYRKWAASQGENILECPMSVAVFLNAHPIWLSKCEPIARLMKAAENAPAILRPEDDEEIDGCIAILQGEQSNL